MSSHISVFLLFALLAFVEKGLGLPLMKPQVEQSRGEVLTHRTKRCACSSPLDAECHYFCHLDIIWVNTPSKTTVYGLGSAMSRRRRSTGRCACASSDDGTCSSFCQQSFEINFPQRSAKRRRFNLQSIGRGVESRSRRIRGAPDSD